MPISSPSYPFSASAKSARVLQANHRSSRPFHDWNLTIWTPNGLRQLMLKRPRPTHPKVLVTRRLPSAMEARMRELLDVTLHTKDPTLNQDDLLGTYRQFT